MAKAKLEDTHIVTTIGTDDFVSKKPKSNEVKAPKPICTAPINAEALPAYLEKGASAKADVFGAVNPTQAKIINKNIINSGSVIQVFKIKSKNIKAVTVCTIKAVKAIC